MAGALAIPAAQAGGRGKSTGERSVAIAPNAITRGGQGFDYRSLKPELSKVKYKDNEIIRDKMKVPMSAKDLGACPEPSEEPCPVELHVEVVRPKAVKPYPTILEVSPYHGTIADRSGTRIFPGPKANDVPDYVDSQEEVPTDKTLGLAGYFAPRGYAVVFVDLRGTGKSGGCLDHLGKKDQSDAKDVLQWINKQKWSNGRIGMTGHSYVGSTPQMYASVQEKSMNASPLKTIVPSAGLGAMYHHKFQHGVPYFLQWIGPAEAYIQLSYQRYALGFLGQEYGDSEGDNEEFFACQAENSAVMSQADFESGRYDDSAEGGDAAGDEFIGADWDTERDFRDGVTKSDMPIFAVHGVNDNAARIPALDWFHDRDGKKGDKAWIGQWDHGSNFFPNDRTCPQHATTVKCPNDQWTLALHAWFDKHLAKRDVGTGPSTEIFLNDRRSVYQVGSFWPPRPQNRGTGFWLHPTENENGTMKLLPRKSEETGSADFTASPDGALLEYDETSELGDNALGWDSPPMKNDIILAGIPKLRLFASFLDDPGTPPYVIATLYDVAPNGEIECVKAAFIGSRCGISKATYAMNPELAQGPAFVKRWAKPTERKLVVPSTKLELKTRGMAQAYLLKKGHSLRLVIATSQPDKVPVPERNTGQITIYMGGDDESKIGVPVVRDARLRSDTFYKTGGADETMNEWETTNN